MSTQVWTRQGARELDRAAAAQASATAAVEQARADEAAALAQLRVQQAQEEAADRAQARRKERRKADAADRRERRAQLAATVRASAVERRALLAVLAMMVLSAGTAVPAQFNSYRDLTGDGLAAGVIAAMVEGGTWLGAALESAAHARKRSPVPARVLTWVLALVAAAVNIQHGLAPGDGREGRWDVAAVFAAASLLGPLCWAMYAHLQTGTDRPHVRGSRRLRMLRRLRFPRLVWRALSLRAAVVPPVTVDEAWAQVWTDHQSCRRVEVGPEVAPIESAPIESVVVESSPVESIEPIESVPIGSIGSIEPGSTPDRSAPDQSTSDRSGSFPIDRGRRAWIDRVSDRSGICGWSWIG